MLLAVQYAERENIFAMTKCPSPPKIIHHVNQKENQAEVGNDGVYEDISHNTPLKKVQEVFVRTPPEKAGGRSPLKCLSINAEVKSNQNKPLASTSNKSITSGNEVDLHEGKKFL